MESTMTLETMRRIWEHLMDLGDATSMSLANEVLTEIVERTKLRDLILDYIHEAGQCTFITE